MGRKRDEFWQYVDTSNGNKCIFCGHGIPGASRIKFHLAQVAGEGIRICNNVPDEVRSAATSAVGGSNKRVKQSKIPNDLEEINISSNLNSTLPRGSTEGNIEVDLLPTADLVGEKFQRHIDKIWDWLTGDEVSVMGVWGMGGVGKTALLKHIHNKLHKDKHDVIWITVSQNDSTSQLQRAIAMSIDENILKNEDELKIAASLLSAFKKKKKCVVILDDVWCDISLEDVGIPPRDNGIKIIVASRLLDVCRSMDCRENILEVKPLCNDEAFTLFSNTLGEDVTLHDDITSMATELTAECEGLPLAIVRIARSLRGKTDIREWRNTLSKLRSPEMDQYDVKRYVFPKLKYSFDRLNDRTLQDCFLCLPLYRENWKIRKLLIRSFVDEGLINGRQGFEAQLDEGQSILNKLINNSLVEPNAYDIGVALHKLMYAMAVNIGKENHGYMYKTELPDEREWKEDLQKISLISGAITGVPSIMPHRCPKLTTFRMCHYSLLKAIPVNFFINMPALKILDLSNNDIIEVLPASISNLVCLTVLLLSWCILLHHIPSLAKLRQLRRLDLSNTAITQIPTGFENLINLRWLNMIGYAVMKAQYLERLHMLESIAAIFVDKDDFIACVRIIEARINSGLIRGYLLRLQRDRIDSPLDEGGYYDMDNHNKTVSIEGIERSALFLPTDINVLKILSCSQWESLCDVLSIQQSNKKLHISRCIVKRCKKLEYLFCSSNGCTLCSSLHGLNELDLGDLSLSMLCKENEAASSFLPFSHLTKLSIRRCNGMKKLLTPGMSTQLHNLGEIEVENCHSMEEIFSRGKSNIRDEYLSLLGVEPYEVDVDDSKVEAINLPNLKSVSLRRLPQLKIVCKGIIVCGSLKEFNIVDCPKLKCVPQTQPPFEIQVKDRFGQRIQFSNGIPMVVSK